jgi:hypothetical protein
MTAMLRLFAYSILGTFQSDFAVLRIRETLSSWTISLMKRASVGFATGVHGTCTVNKCVKRLK